MMTKHLQYILYLVLLVESLDDYINNPHKEGIVMLIIARKRKISLPFTRLENKPASLEATLV